MYYTISGSTKYIHIVNDEVSTWLSAIALHNITVRWRPGRARLAFAPLLNVLSWFCFQSHVYERLYISLLTISCPFIIFNVLAPSNFHSFKFLFLICRKLDNKALLGVTAISAYKLKGAQWGISQNEWGALGGQEVDAPTACFFPRTQRVRLLRTVHKTKYSWFCLIFLSHYFTLMVSL